MRVSVADWHRLMRDRAWFVAALHPVLADSTLRFTAKWSAAIVVGLVATDVVSGLAKHKGFLSENLAYVLRLSNDGSLGEIAGQVALQSSAFLLAYTAWRLRSALHWLLASSLQFLFFDDVFSLHEQTGEWLGERFFAAQKLFPAKDLGELSFGLAIGLVLTCLVARHFRTSTVWQRMLCAIVILPIVILGFFGVVVDFSHALVPADDKFLGGLGALLEDGGELASSFLIMLGAATNFLYHDQMPVRDGVELRWIAAKTSRLSGTFPR